MLVGLGEQAGLREVVPCGVAPGAKDEIAQQLLGDVHEHQADQDLTRAEAISQERGDGRPRHAAQRAGEQQRRHDRAALVSSVAASATRPAQMAPRMNWPSAPMFQMLARKLTASPRPMSSSGRGLDGELAERAHALERLDEEQRRARAADLARALRTDRAQHERGSDARSAERRTRRAARRRRELQTRARRAPSTSRAPPAPSARDRSSTRRCDRRSCPPLSCAGRGGRRRSPPEHHRSRTARRGLHSRPAPPSRRLAER